jgi:hypothetical protein
MVVYSPCENLTMKLKIRVFRRPLEKLVVFLVTFVLRLMALQLSVVPFFYESEFSDCSMLVHIRLWFDSSLLCMLIVLYQMKITFSIDPHILLSPFDNCIIFLRSSEVSNPVKIFH